MICKNSAKLGEKKNMNLPGAVVDLPTLTEKDETDLIEFGLKQGMAVTFAVEGDHIALRPAAALRQPGTSGFGLIPSRHPAIAPDFDVATLVASEP